MTLTENRMILLLENQMAFGPGIPGIESALKTGVLRISNRNISFASLNRYPEEWQSG